MPELADGPDLGSGAAMRGGSSPPFPTIAPVLFGKSYGILRIGVRVNGLIKDIVHWLHNLTESPVEQHTYNDSAT